MIQIDDWMLIAGILAIFLLFSIYLAYFIISRKLFPKVLEFQKEIKPNEAITVATIKGSGIIKKIEMNATQNEATLIDMIVDQTNYVIFSSGKKTSSQSGNLNGLGENLSFEMNLDKKFGRNFSIFFHNNSDKLSHSNGKIYYEIRQPLKITLRSILSELR